MRKVYCLLLMLFCLVLVSWADLPGYAVVTVSPERGEAILHYYNGFSERPYQEVNLSTLQRTGNQKQSVSSK